MKKLILNFEFNYYMDGEGEEDKETAIYKIEVNEVNLSKPEIENVLQYLQDDIRKEVGYFEFKAEDKTNEFIWNAKTEEFDAENIMSVLEKTHQKFKLLFKDFQVGEISPIDGHNDLIYNTRNKFKMK